MEVQIWVLFTGWAVSSIIIGTVMDIQRRRIEKLESIISEYEAQR